MTASKPKRPLLDLPFSKRWRRQLEVWMNNGGWYVLSAGSQQGKTTANKQFEVDHPAVRSSAGTVIPIAQAWAARGRRPLLRSLAESLGGSTAANMYGRETRVPKLIARFQTRLIIVNNAHHMDWRQWQELVNLDDVCVGREQWRPAIVFSGVFTKKELPGLPEDSPAEAEQIHKRILGFKFVPGHDRAEVRAAMELLLAEHSPTLLAQRAQTHAGQVFELLTRPEVDLRRTGFVATGDLVELVLRMAAARRAGGGRTIKEVIDIAFNDFQRHRLGKVA